VAWMQAADGAWQRIRFTIDCGADWTALPARYAHLLGVDVTALPVRTDAGGVGSGSLAYIEYATTLRFTADNQQRDYPVTTMIFLDPADLDVPLLGRDILDQLTLILDRPRDTILLLPGPETYVLVPSANSPHAA